MRSLLPGLRGLAALALCGLLASCATSSSAFIERHPTYLLATGQVTRIENMSTDKVETLSDGRAVTVSGAGCRVLLSFDGERSKFFEVVEGTIIVHGKNVDYLLLPNAYLDDGPPAGERTSDREAVPTGDEAPAGDGGGQPESETGEGFMEPAGPHLPGGPELEK